MASLLHEGGLKNSKDLDNHNQILKWGLAEVLGPDKIAPVA